MTDLAPIMLPIPHRCIQTLHPSPTALGCYALIAWLYVQHMQDYGKPVPLSQRDRCTYDAPRSRSSIIRAMTRLTTTGWVLITRPELKNRYTPTWGVISRAVRPWDLDQPRWGRPQHVTTLALDAQVFVDHFGTLTPLPQGHAWITPTEAQRLTLADIGIYLQARAGAAVTTPRLDALGLLAAPAAGDAG